MLESANRICRVQCRHQSAVRMDTYLASCIRNRARRNLPHTDNGCDASLNFGLIGSFSGTSVVFKDVCAIAVTVDFISGGGRSEDGFKPLQCNEV
jgi:hypothetical protein